LATRDRAFEALCPVWRHCPCGHIKWLPDLIEVAAGRDDVANPPGRKAIAIAGGWDRNAAALTAATISDFFMIFWACHLQFIN